MRRKKYWYDYLWIASGLYIILGFFNILFAWLGLICFIVPLLISVISGSKAYCNRYCGRGHSLNFWVTGLNFPEIGIYHLGCVPNGFVMAFWPSL